MRKYYSRSHYLTGDRSNINNIITKNTFVILNTRGSIFDIVAPDSCFEIVLRLISVCFEIDFSLFEIDLIDYYFCLLVVCEHTQQIDVKIRKLYCATLLSFFFKKRNIEHALIFVTCCYHDQAQGFQGALQKHSLLHQKFKFHKYFYTGYRYR